MWFKRENNFNIFILDQKQLNCLLGLKYLLDQKLFGLMYNLNNVFLRTMSTQTNIALEHSYLEQCLLGLSLLGTM